MKINTRKLMVLLAVLCLITSSFVGSTLAKYTTSATANDSARVAEFGVVVTADSTAFNAEYAKNVDTHEIATTVSAEEKVIAPGTKGTLGTSKVTGTPEVAVEVKREATLELGDNWVDGDGNYYCPLVITVGTDAYLGTNYASADEFEAAVLGNEKLVKTTNYDPNTNLADNDDVAVTWEWAFEGNDDEKDTDLGDQAAAGNAATIAFSLTTTVTQLD